MRGQFEPGGSFDKPPTNSSIDSLTQSVPSRPSFNPGFFCCPLPLCLSVCLLYVCLPAPFCPALLPTTRFLASAHTASTQQAHSKHTQPPPRQGPPCSTGRLRLLHHGQGAPSPRYLPPSFQRRPESLGGGQGRPAGGPAPGQGLQRASKETHLQPLQVHAWAALIAYIDTTTHATRSTPTTPTTPAMPTLISHAQGPRKR